MTVQIICEGACNNYAVEGIDHDLFEAQVRRGHGTGVCGDEGLWTRIRQLKYTEHIQLTVRHYRCVVCQKVRIFGWSEMEGAHGEASLLTTAAEADDIRATVSKSAAHPATDGAARRVQPADGADRSERSAALDEVRHANRELLGPRADVAGGAIAAALELDGIEAAKALQRVFNELQSKRVDLVLDAPPPPLRMHDVVKKP